MMYMATQESRTMTANQDCPTRATLKEYLFGQTDETLGGIIDLHLESCSICNDTIESLECELGPSLGLSEQQVLEDAIMEAKLPIVQRDIPETIGPYRLLQSIGRGGMGEVYRAEHTKLKKTVAIKLLPLCVASAHAVERFNREIQAAGKLNHPAIVNSTDAGVNSGYQYLAMEFIEGVDLGRLSKGIREISSADVCEIGRQMALGLAHAHSMGMVHRDIKPSNVMLDSSGSVKLLDFGLVLLSQWDSPIGELTTVGQFLGTLDYMAPEQAERSASVNHQSDIYSLGVTLFRLLTTQLPLAMLPNQSPLEKLRVLTTHSPVRIQTLRKDLPSGLANLIDQMLRTDPKDRPASAAHVAESLQPFCDGADLSKLAKRGIEIASSKESIEEQIHLPKVQILNRNSIRSGAPWWLVLTAACLPFLSYLGMNLVLEDASGNLVVQSEVDQVHVRLIKPDGKLEKDWQIQQGNSITKLQSGNYEITLDAPSDTVAIDKSTLIIKKGETVVARISKQPPTPTEIEPIAGTGATLAGRLETSETDTSWLPKNTVPDSVLNSTYKGEQIIEYLRSIHLERERERWRWCLTVLEQAIPSKYKAELAGFIVAEADERKFIDGEAILGFSDWLSDEEIDERCAAWLQNSREFSFASGKIINFIQKVRSDLELNTKVAVRPIDYSKLKRSWAFIEDWLSKGKGIERSSELRILIQKLQASTTQVDFLFEQYPYTAFTVCMYYDFKFINDGTGNRLIAMVDGADRQAIRVKARTKIAKHAIEQSDFERFAWILNDTNQQPENVAIEAPFWKLSGEQLGTYYKAWAASNQPVLSDGVRAHLTTQQNSYRIDVLPASVKRSGMGGMGGSMVLPKFTVSKSIELLAAYETIPVDFRPVDALEEVREMLSTFLPKENSKAEELLPMEWSQLQWNDQYRLEYADQNGKIKSFRPEDQQIVEVLVLHRWANNLLYSDRLGPEMVCENFMNDIREKGSSGEGVIASKWIVSRGKKEFLSIENPLASIRAPEVQGYVARPRFRRALVTNDLLNEQSTVFFELELEREGWRIHRITMKKMGNMNVLFDF